MTVAGSRAGERWAAALVFLAALLPYAALPGKPLVYDALPAIAANEAVQRAPLEELFTVDFWGREPDDPYVTRSYRPLVSLSYALQARFPAIGGAGGFHLVDLLLHGMIAVLLFRLTRRLGLSREFGVLTALIYGVHPAVSEAVCSVVGRADLLAAAALLGAMLARLRGTSSRCAPAWNASALLLLAAGMLCKEYAVAFPFILALLDPVVRLPLGRAGTIAWWAALGTVLSAYLAVRLALFGALGGVPNMGPEIHPLFDRPLTVRIATGCSLLTLAARLLVLPHPLNHHYRFGTLPVVEHPWAPAALGGIAIAAALVALAGWAWIRRDSRVPALAVALVLLPLAPGLNIVSLSGVMFAERFLVLPVAGTALLLGWCLQRWSGERAPRTVRVGLLLLLLLAAAATAVRVRDWGSLERLARSSIAAYPNGAEAWEQLGVALLRQQRPQDALEPLARAAALNPDHPLPLSYRAEALAGLGRHREAVDDYRRALGLMPDATRLWIGLGRSELQLGETDEAVRALSRALALAPEVDETRALLGQARLRLAQTLLGEGDRVGAVGLAGEAVADGLPPAGLFLAGLIAHEAGDESLAAGWFEAALAGDPDLPRRKHELARALERRGRLEEAIGQLRELLAALPDDPPTLFNLGRLSLLAGRPAEAEEFLLRGLDRSEDPRARELLDQARKQAR